MSGIFSNDGVFNDKLIFLNGMVISSGNENDTHF